MTTNEDFHAERERECREMAAAATDPEIRRRHEELAALHASLKRDMSAPSNAPPAAAESHA